MLLLDPAWAEAEAQAIVNDVLTHYPAPRLVIALALRLQRARLDGALVGMSLASKVFVHGHNPEPELAAAAVDLARMMDGHDA